MHRHAHDHRRAHLHSTSLIHLCEVTDMKLKYLIIPLITLILISGCAQDDRTARVEQRQDRMDNRTEGRQERWKVRADRQDARAAAFVESR